MRTGWKQTCEMVLLKKIIVDGKEKWVGHTGIIIAYDKGTDIIFYRRKYR